MFRRTIILLVFTLILTAAADWQRFKAGARPVLQPLVQWCERGKREHDATPPADDLGRSVNQLIRSLDEGLREQRLQPIVPERRRDGGSLDWSADTNSREEPRTVRDRLRVVESALAEARRDAERLQREMDDVELKGGGGRDIQDLERRREILRERISRLATLHGDLQRQKL